MSLALQMKKVSPPNLSQWGRKEEEESKNILSLAQKLDSGDALWLGWVQVRLRCKSMAVISEASKQASVV